VSSVHHFELDVIDGRAALMRIMAVCHERNCPIVAFHYERGGPVILSVEISAERPGRLELWLEKLIPVLAVRQRPEADHGYGSDTWRTASA
jgi:hypothetical protein